MASQPTTEANMDNNGEVNNHPSGTTSPVGTTLFSGSLRRSDSKETLASSNNKSDVESNPSIALPPPPANSPTTQSLAGEANTESLDEVIQQLSNLPGPTPPNSLADAGEGKAHLRSRIRSDVPLLQQLFKQPPKKLLRKTGKITKKALAGSSSPAPHPTEENVANGGSHFHEYTTWKAIAKDDIAKGLERLARAAKDEHQIDSSKSVEEYFGVGLAEVLKEAEIKFDPKYLQ